MFEERDPKPVVDLLRSIADRLERGEQVPIAMSIDTGEHVATVLYAPLSQIANLIISQLGSLLEALAASRKDAGDHLHSHKNVSIKTSKVN